MLCPDNLSTDSDSVHKHNISILCYQTLNTIENAKSSLIVQFSAKFNFPSCLDQMNGKGKLKKQNKKLSLVSMRFYREMEIQIQRTDLDQRYELQQQ